MLNPNQFVTHRTALSTQRQRPKGRLRKKKRIVAVFSIAFIYFYCFTGEEPSEVVRQLQSQATGNQGQGIANSNANSPSGGNKKGCSHTPYVLIGDILTTMPPIIPYEERITIPSHIQLCQGFLERSAENSLSGNVNSNDAGGNGQNGEARKLQNGIGQGNLNGIIHVMEDEAVCTDWEAPHLSVLEIYASSLIASVGKPLGLRYEHKCRKNIMKMHNDPDRPYDYTTVQALLPNNLISKADIAKVDPDTIKKLCENCIGNFENVMNVSASVSAPPSTKTHHCLLMPHGEIAQSLVSEGRHLPMIHVMPSLVDRMRHIADDWSPTTGPISKNEEDVGVIIAVDEGSSFMNFDVYNKLIPPAARSIQIFASANCAIAAVEGRSDCIEHGRRLKRYFLQTRSRQFGTYVRYDVVGSTAASFARMINCRILICPPGTVMCLLPALSKKAGKNAYIAEDPAHEETFDWFEHEVLEERKNAGIQDVDYDIADEEFLNIINDVDTTMDVAAIGENENEDHPPSDADLDGDQVTEEYNFTEWLSNASTNYTNWLSIARNDTNATEVEDEVVEGNKE